MLWKDVNWTHLAHSGVQSQGLVNMVMSLLA